MSEEKEETGQTTTTKVVENKKMKDIKAAEDEKRKKTKKAVFDPVALMDGDEMWESPGEHPKTDVETTSATTTTTKSKLSSVFDIDHFMEQEYQSLLSFTSANSRKKTMVTYRKFFKSAKKYVAKKKTFGARSNVGCGSTDSMDDFIAPTPPIKKRKKKNDDPGQPKIDSMLLSKHSVAPTPDVDYDSDEKEEKSQKEEDEDSMWEASLGAASLDDLLAIPDDYCDQEATDYMSELEEKVRQTEEKDMREELEEKENKARAEKEAEFERENAEMSHRLRRELTEARIRSLVRQEWDFLQRIWSGSASGSGRRTAYAKGGSARRALLYRMITHPFTVKQNIWVLDEIQTQFMPTRELVQEHKDFVWKVVLPEANIAIYARFFGLESHEEAEKRIRQTPLNEEDEDEDEAKAVKSQGKQIATFAS